MCFAVVKLSQCTAGAALRFALCVVLALILQYLKVLSRRIVVLIFSVCFLPFKLFSRLDQIFSCQKGLDFFFNFFFFFETSFSNIFRSNCCKRCRLCYFKKDFSICFLRFVPSMFEPSRNACLFSIAKKNPSA